MTPEEKKKLLDEMKKEGLPEDAINKVLQGLQDEEDGKVFSIDEAYKRLYAKDKMGCLK